MTWPLVFWIPVLGSIVAMVVLPQLKFGQRAEAFADWLAKGVITHVHVVRGCTLKPKALRLYFERPPEGYPRTMSRGDFAVGGFWLVSLIIFISGQQQRLSLPERDKHQADPLFYTGIVLIAHRDAGAVVLSRRPRESGAAARVAEPATDDSGPRRVGVAAAGRPPHVQREARATGRAFWSTMALRLGTPTLFLTPCVDIGLTADVRGRRLSPHRRRSA